MFAQKQLILCLFQTACLQVQRTFQFPLKSAKASFRWCI